MLRDYQQRAIDQLYDWFSDNPSGNPCLVLPTGSGKSHIVAALCKDAVQSWTDTRILMLTHSKELIEQNAEKMRLHWPNAPLGIYSASLRKKDIDQITFGAIQTLRTKSDRLGHIDLIIVDECHLISNKETGGYRFLIDQLTQINPNLRVIGLTATPYRLGQGILTDGDDALFTDIIDPVNIIELVARGFLSPLKSKHTYSKIDTSKLHKRGGEYIPKEIESAANEVLESALAETIARAEGRQHWLVFCSGVDNAEQAASMLNEMGINARCLTGKNSKPEREQILHEFTGGKIQALTNANILTTGFDFPDIDLLVMLRPTLSTSLYVQMAGRGMRVKSHTDHCMVLDFAGNVAKHGPITDITPPSKSGGGGDAPVKVCPDCFEQLLTFVKVCPECGHQFVPDDAENKKEFRLSNADIMGIEPDDMEITDWLWSKHTSRSSGKEMIKVKYYGGLSDPVIIEYFPITHEGSTQHRAYSKLQDIAMRASLKGAPATNEIEDIASWMQTGQAPSIIQYKKSGKFYEVKSRIWANESI